MHALPHLLHPLHVRLEPVPFAARARPLALTPPTHVPQRHAPLDLVLQRVRQPRVHFQRTCAPPRRPLLDLRLEVRRELRAQCQIASRPQHPDQMPPDVEEERIAHPRTRRHHARVSEHNGRGLGDFGRAEPVDGLEDEGRGADLALQVEGEARADRHVARGEEERLGEVVDLALEGVGEAGEEEGGRGEARLERHALVLLLEQHCRRALAVRQLALALGLLRAEGVGAGAAEGGGVEVLDLRLDLAGQLAREEGRGRKPALEAHHPVLVVPKLCRDPLVMLQLGLDPQVLALAHRFERGQVEVLDLLLQVVRHFRAEERYRRQP
mmetsp:Transcript_839/g.2009  ORF Transcript_839/g.2009 Transcript_839/m.2009 type:complete len:325 (-) Transcript_839:413-1387(-)